MIKLITPSFETACSNLYKSGELSGWDVKKSALVNCQSEISRAKIYTIDRNEIYRPCCLYTYFRVIKS